MSRKMQPAGFQLYHRPTAGAVQSALVNSYFVLVCLLSQAGLAIGCWIWRSLCNAPLEGEKVIDCLLKSRSDRGETTSARFLRKLRYQLCLNRVAAFLLK